ncbi:hypothetical protein K435DRAFT_780919 [Dendrothele bispora CBS 962.96]|uniref:DUF6699 domain-containing protein n=1 Tax=Dendrothele bispora (strain CBS 962.96) TaxID=1314807 RepID=A0A4S8LNV5_DENBC|nr:hypothetical protein K435DRAFT_780919 [Dendrothele bispora CBS 962.96]
MNVTFYPSPSPRLPLSWPIATFGPLPYYPGTPSIVNVQYGPNYYFTPPPNTTPTPKLITPPPQPPLTLPSPRQPTLIPFQVRPHPLLSMNPHPDENPYVHWNIVDRPEHGASAPAPVTRESMNEQAFYFSRGEPAGIVISIDDNNGTTGDNTGIQPSINDWIQQWGPITVTPNYRNTVLPLMMSPGSMLNSPGGRTGNPKFTIGDVLSAIWRHFYEPLTPEEVGRMNEWYPGYLDKYRMIREQIVLRRGLVDPNRVYRRSDVLGQRIRFGGFSVVEDGVGSGFGPGPGPGPGLGFGFGSGDRPNDEQNCIKLALLDA